MTAAERKAFAQELLEADFSQKELEKYLSGPMSASPMEYRAAIDAIKEETGGGDPDGGQGPGASDSDMDSYLADRFPETQKAE